MRRENIEDDLQPLIFEFFFWFSRFESALKEWRYLVSNQVGAPAQPNWKHFVDDFRDGYEPDDAAKRLLDAKPQRQIVGEHDLDFVEVPFADDTPQLDRVVTLVKTVRNNLFHGGKHGSAYWDDPKRMRLLLSISIRVLNDLARVGGLEADYTGYY